MSLANLDVTGPSISVLEASLWRSVSQPHQRPHFGSSPLYHYNDFGRHDDTLYDNPYDFDCAVLQGQGRAQPPTLRYGMGSGATQFWTSPALEPFSQPGLGGQGQVHTPLSASIGSSPSPLQHWSALESTTVYQTLYSPERGPITFPNTLSFAGQPTAVEPEVFAQPAPATVIQQETRAIADKRRPATPIRVLPEKGRKRLYACKELACWRLKPMKLSAWKQHQFVHTKEKPFACEYCRRPFPKKGNLTRHYKACPRRRLELLSATSRCPSSSFRAC